MLVPILKSTGERLSTGDVIKDQIGRDWLFWYGHKPALVVNLPDGEIHVKKLETDARPKGFSTHFFPDVEFKEIVSEKPTEKAKKPIEIKRRKVYVKPKTTPALQ